MSILTNKHVVVALIVTPILAVLGYFMVDSMVSEKPHAAKAGGHYELVALPNCRYQSGQCVMKNGDFKLTLTASGAAGGNLQLRLESVFPLDAALISQVSSDGSNPPQPMRADDPEGLVWQLQLPPQASGAEVRVAVAVNQAWYYGEAPLLFTEYATVFGKDFRREAEH
ncbi:hypothetical protein [Pseudomaricurvus sp. HS19]|uniref:hypothetical protein n=1 Tax=Pseudomaricurvus sp. HS19 TaxID=2692626 RepID=UPI00137004A2|nr:hypothetical protein [Pseudomaricurvus sp. HS19]MYM64608.1 hypothetical protein [Pseudomaricurvus sp. HS19]